MDNYDFCGWATKANLKCSDGRIIMKDAFKHCDGRTVPLVWGHQHNDPLRVLGHAVLEHRDEGVYAYGVFNETEQGQTAKMLVEHGDVEALSIYANQLKQTGPNVMHGDIKELSLVLAGANPGAYIENVIRHSDDPNADPVVVEDEGFIFSGEVISLYHEDSEDKDPESEETPEKEEEIKHEDAEKTEKKEKTLGDILGTLNEEQEEAVYALIGLITENDEKNKDSEGGTKEMKHNVFDTNEEVKGNVITHADGMSIISLAKQSNVGTLKAAYSAYAAQNESFAHGFVDEDGNEAINLLFPEFKDVHGGAPELIERDQSWVAHIWNKVHKSPISRIRTRQADARAKELRAKGYNDRTKAKALSGEITLITRTTEPQTIYRRDELHRDDIIDITDFDVVAYQKNVMYHNMKEEIALASLIGDGRTPDDVDKIKEDRIRPVWTDDEMYTIHHTVDFAEMKTKLQGTNTNANFGEEYIYAEAIIAAALYSREQYKGKGKPDFYCTPRLLNTMLLARDLNGRRIYDSAADLAKAMNVGEIHTVEQFADADRVTRTNKDGKQVKLLGLFVNMNNYQYGATKGGEISTFEDFDIDFNNYKYLMEGRMSGALVEIKSAIALEELVSEG